MNRHNILYPLILQTYLFIVLGVSRLEFSVHREDGKGNVSRNVI